MAGTDRNGSASPWGEGLRAAAAKLSWVRVLRASAGVAMLAAGLATAGGAAWAVVAARQTMHGRMATYARYTPRPSMVHVGTIEIAENTP